MNLKIKKKSLAEEVVEVLRQQIVSGKYKIGEKLPIESELMKTFGVGRSSIREAIKILSNIGLLSVQQGVGTFVSEMCNTKEPLNLRLKRADYVDLNEVRELLEMKIAEKAAIGRSKEDIFDMQKFIAERKLFAEKGQTKECINSDINFHIAIAKASKNEIFFDLYKAASVHLLKWFLELHQNTEDFIKTQNLHEELLQNIIDQNPEKAWATSAKIIGHVTQIK